MLPLSPFPFTAQTFLFDTPYQLTMNQILTLQLTPWGESARLEFNDSRFDVQWINGSYQWIVKRIHFTATSFNIPHLDKAGSFYSVDSWGLDFAAACNEKVPFFMIDQLPDHVHGAGFLSQVYQIVFPPNRAAVFKIERCYSHTKVGQLFYPIRLKEAQSSDTSLKASHFHYIDPQNKAEMHKSFYSSLVQFRAMQRLPSSIYYPETYGLIYVKELNLWGVISEFIEGKHLFAIYRDHRQAKKNMCKVVDGLAFLDSLGYAYTDLKRSNVLLKQDGSTVLVDNIARGEPVFNAEYSQLSRKQFGTLLYNALSKSSPFKDDLFKLEIPEPQWIAAHRSKICKELGQKLGSLICDCWGELSMEEVSWDSIKKRLGSS